MTGDRSLSMTEAAAAFEAAVEDELAELSMADAGITDEERRDRCVQALKAAKALKSAAWFAYDQFIGLLAVTHDRLHDQQRRENRANGRTEKETAHA